MKLVILLVLVTLAFANATENCAGCAQPLDLVEAKKILDTSLNKLATLEGPYYKSGTIHSATQQVVAGIIYRINTDLIDAASQAVTCNVEIFKQPWLGNTQVTFKCQDADELEKSYKD